MKGLLKWIAIIIVIIIVIMVIGVIAVLLITPKFIDTAGFKAPIELYLSKATGRPVSIDDDIKLRLFPWAEVSLSNLKVGNKKGSEHRKLLSVQADEVNIKLLPSLSRRGIIEIFAQLNAIKSLVGTDAGASFDKDEARDMAAFLVEDIRVTNGLVTITDKKNDTSRLISGLNLTLNDVSFERPVGVSLSANVDDIPTSIKGYIGPIGDQPGKDPIAVNLLITALDQLQVQVNGTVENALDDPSVDIVLEVAEFSPRLLAKELGQTLPVADNSAVLNRLSLKANVKGGTDSIVISDGILMLDESTMHFTSKARNFDKPNFRFDLSLDRINLDRYVPPNNEDAKDKLSQVFLEASSKKTYYAPIRKLVLDGKVSIGELIINNEKIDNTTLHIKAKNGLLSLDPR
jgi:AsmA protein